MELFIIFIVIAGVFKLIGIFSKNEKTKSEIDEAIERAWYGPGGKDGMANKVINAIFGIIAIFIIGFFILIISII